ncbi:hypothetical protein ACIOHK_30920, partial [Streptomyces sp. NPDC088115]
MFGTAVWKHCSTDASYEPKDLQPPPVLDPGFGEDEILAGGGLLVGRQPAVRQFPGEGVDEVFAWRSLSLPASSPNSHGGQDLPAVPAQRKARREYEKKNRSSSGLVGSSAKVPYASACSSLRNSTGT